MTFDPRSRERLEALGRRLPQPLPLPQPASPAAAAGGGRPPSLHPLETEEDPEQLFRELMAASPDGSVPPHHLERLRQLEQRPAAAAAAAAAAEATPARPASAPRPRRSDGGGSARAAAADPDRQLYATFAQMLLEQDEND
jgi:hypothetical protein